MSHVLYRPKGSRILIINGNIKGEEVYLSNCVVKGNVKSNNVIVGPNVEITDLIEFSEKLEISTKTEKNYESKQINSAEE